jgi:hypothetical protein
MTRNNTKGTQGILVTNSIYGISSGTTTIDDAARLPLCDASKVFDLVYVERTVLRHKIEGG